MADIKCPEMKWETGDDPASLNEYRTRLERWFVIREVQKEKQYHYIIFQAGDKGEHLSRTWGLSHDELKQPDTVWTKFEQSVGASTNFRIQRLTFSSCRQKEEETIDEYHSRMKSIGIKCKFVSLNDRLIDQLIMGTKLQESRKELLRQNAEMTVEQALTICRTHESSISHMRTFEQLMIPQYEDSNRGNTIHATSMSCGWCGLHHSKESRCPAKGSTCRNCSKLNHWACVCRSKPKNDTTTTSMARKEDRTKTYTKSTYTKPKKKGINVMAQEEEITEEDQMFDTITIRHDNLLIQSIEEKNRDEVFVTLPFQHIKRHSLAQVKLKLDTGAQGNTLPLRIYQKMFPGEVDTNGKPTPGILTPSKVKLRAYNGGEITHYGTITLTTTTTSPPKDVRFYVVDVSGPAILGLPDCERLSLVTIHQSVCTVHNTPSQVNSVTDLQGLFPSQFDQIGSFKDRYHIVLDPNVPPCIHAARRVPIHVKDEIVKELEEMKQMGIIREVSEPTDWVSSITWSKKSNGQWRICLDPKDLNRAIKRPVHKTPTLDEIQHQLSGAKVFSKLDAKNGYWSIHLDKDSQLLTTFNSPIGRLCFQRMPFGLRMSQDVFQHRMDGILERVGKGVIGIADDVIVYGNTEQEHDVALFALMKIAQEEGLCFNSAKCAIKTPSINFFGQVYDQHGIHPDPTKVDDIHSLPSPDNKGALQHFLGMVTYMGPFIPNLSTLTSPLRNLLKKDVEFSWTASHEAAFTKLKENICKEASLSYFDPAEASTIQVDASSSGLGACLLQKGRPVAFASKALTNTEQRYANIEREMLAVVFGCTRFHNYIYGKPFVIETDHKPLENIAMKNINTMPARLQRLFLTIQQYDCDIHYRPGKEMVLPDSLSRLPSRDKTAIDLDVRVQFVHFSAQRLQELKQETGSDPTLSSLLAVISHGWPDDCRQLPKYLRPYWSFRQELTAEDGIVCRGDRAVIPEAMKHYILHRLHVSHQGIVKTQLLARDHVFWINIDKDIAEKIQTCPTCNKHARSQSQEPLLPHAIPDGPWMVLGTDLFKYAGMDYLIVADYYSKYVITRRMHQTSSKAVIAALKQIMGEYGIPQKLISDNGPQYASDEFTRFVQHWNINHSTSSPHFPQSNGFIERMVQTTKRTWTKADEDGVDRDLAMLHLRCTPIDSSLPSPLRILCTRTPSILPHVVRQNKAIKEALKKRQDNMKMKVAGKELPPLKPGQQVYCQDPHTKTWTPGVIVTLCDEPRSYVVDTGGRHLRRNRVFLRPCKVLHTHNQPYVAQLPPDVPLELATSPIPAPPVDQGQEEQYPTTSRDTPTTPQVEEEASTAPQTSTDAPVHDDAPRRTRSGREVRPPKRFQD